MHKNISPKDVIFSGLATSVEYFDFVIFAYVTVFISAAFFPDSNSTVGTQLKHLECLPWAILCVL